MREKLLILGGGMAATRLVDELTRQSPDAFDIKLIGAEPREPYNRVLLSSLLAGDVQDADIELKPESWWQARNVKRHLGTSAVELDLAGKRVTLANGTVHSYDKLVLATGSKALKLPLAGADLDGVLTFRDCEDVAALRARVTGGARAVVIGGGLLGLEAAYGLAKIGARVSVVHVMDRLMERQLDGPAAALLQSQLEARGIEFLLEAKTAEIIGKHCVEGLRFDNGDILEADLVVMAVGILPNVALAQEAGIAIKRGILVDDALRSSADHVFAVGECAEHRGIVYGLVEPAYEQARVLADVLRGGPAHYRGSLMSTNLKVSGVGVFSAGDFMGAAGTQSLIWHDRGLNLYRRLNLRETAQGTVLVGCVLIGETGDGLWYRDLIEQSVIIDSLRDTLIFGKSLCDLQAA
jgi:nitrite reductase (NADH) large subunit